jgi:hypothetical protein
MIRKAWREKKEAARAGRPQPRLANGTREGAQLLTRMLPAWLQEQNGRAVPVPERARAVRRVFALAAAGYGSKRTVVRLKAEGVPAFGAHWTRGYVTALLSDRRTLGEYQPRVKRTGKPDGAAIPDYYPAVVSEEEWLAAGAARAQRRRKRGRVSRLVNLFAGLITSARDGESYYAASRKDGSGFRHVLINFASAEGRAPCYAFPMASFEPAVLSLLAEVDPREVLGQEEAPDKALTLAGELAATEGELAAAVAFMEANGFSPAIGKRVQELEAKKAGQAAQLTEAKQEAAHPLSAAWGETRSLLETLEGAADPADARTRLQAALRRIVSGMWLLVVRKGHDRVAALQIHFAGDGVRQYVIYHKPTTAGQSQGKVTWRREGGWWARSFKAAPALDLRKAADVKRAEKLLADYAE